MKMNKLNSFLVLLLSMAFISCEDNLLEGVTSVPADPPAIPATAGSADFSNFVSLGNSLTAGFMDGALYNRGQSFSFPAQLHSSMAQIAGTGTPSSEFNQPDINSENGFFGTAGGGTVILGRLKLNSNSLPEPVLPGEVPLPYEGEKSELNNFGVPGILLGQLLSPDTGNPGSPLYNPLYARFASEPGVSTILGDALATQPTFFSLWAGNNDVLGYAVSGATNEAIFTDPTTFEFLFSQAFGALVSSGAKGVVANIPSVTDIPYFNTVPNNALVLERQSQVDSLNAGFGLFNGGIQLYNSTPGLPEEQKRPTVNFEVGQNLFLIEDNDLPDLTALGLPSIRQMTAEELVGLTVPQDSISIWLAQGRGIPDEFILTSSELDSIAQRVAALNTIIENQVTALGGDNVALVDMNTFFNDFAANGVSRFYGVTIDPSLAPPFGGFSLDGVHPNARGHALVANFFIDAINAKFGSTLPYVSMEGAPGNDFP